MREFKEFIRKGIIKKVSVDSSRATSLIKEAEARKEFMETILNKIGLSDINANYIVEQVYDILMETIRARLFLDGYKTSGSGAHGAEVSYLEILGFSKEDIRFMDDLRYFRNGIKYYGKKFDKEYALKVINFMKIIYPKLNT